MPYPVVTAVVLPPVRRNGLRRPRRDPRDVPPARLGTVYVVRTDGRYAAWGGRHLDLADPTLVEATEVCLVQTRPQQVAVELGLRATAEREVLIQAIFRCRVTDAAAVAEAGIVDINAVITGQLVLDAEIMALAATADLTDVDELRRRAEARVRAYCAVAPPEIDGVEVSLAGVHVITYDDVAPRSPAVVSTEGRP